MADFTLNIENLLKGLSDCENKAQVAMLMYAQNGALKLQNSARKNAPWTNRTGQARQRLSCETEIVENGYREKLAHGVDYGIWLELAHEKRFAIIEPTIQKEGPAVLSGFNKLLEKL